MMCARLLPLPRQFLHRPAGNVTCAHGWQGGGGLYISGTATLIDTNVYQNEARYGANVYISRGELILSGSSLADFTGIRNVDGSIVERPAPSPPPLSPPPSPPPSSPP
eukprot:scaffold101375_cov60-Phaeocystis_antarctica.AAC.1